MLPAYMTTERATLETVSRSYSQTVHLNDRFILCRVLGKYMVYVDPDDIDITPHLCLNGYWEPWITLIIAREVQRGWHCIDVGANLGYYTLIMADAVEADGRVLAIEPNPRLAELLKFTLEVNGFQRHTTVLQKAVSTAETCGVNLVIPPHRVGHATICREETLSDTCVAVETT